MAPPDVRRPLKIGSTRRTTAKEHPLTAILEWEEGIFRGLRGAWKMLFKRQTQQNQSSGVVSLNDLHAELEILAQLIAQLPVRIKPAESLGGLRGMLLLLPTHIDLSEDPEVNLSLYVHRVVIAAEMARLAKEQAYWPNIWVGHVSYLFAAHRAVRSLTSTFDRFAEGYRQLAAFEQRAFPIAEDLSGPDRDFEDLRRQLMSMAADEDTNEQEADQIMRFARIDHRPKFRIGTLLWGGVLGDHEVDEEDAPIPLSQDANPGRGSEKKAPVKDHVHRTFLEKVEEIEPLPLHTFEKTETADNYRGGSRQVDGDDELDDHLEALEELDLREIIRGGRETRSIYQADLDLGGGIPDVHHILPHEQGIPYPEWHHQTQSYRPDWVTVYPTRTIRPDLASAQAVLKKRRFSIETLTNRLLAHRTRHTMLARQSDGDQIDLNAAVEAICDRRAGQTPNENCYATLTKTREPNAVTILLDISLSSGSWIEGRRVLDVTREAVLILGAVADRLGDALQIMGFAGNTRNHCRIFEVKSWTQPWSSTYANICGLEPQGYTRIGPAIRHANHRFKTAPSAKQLLLLITDGKPTDYDRYEGIYGLQDVKRAVKEGCDLGISTFALGLDPKARTGLATMFGVGGWQVPTPSRPPSRMRGFGLRPTIGLSSKAWWFRRDAAESVWVDAPAHRCSWGTRA